MAEHTIYVSVKDGGPHLNFKEGDNIADGEHFLSEVQAGDTVVWRKQGTGIHSFVGIEMYSQAEVPGNVELLTDIVTTADSITAKVVDPQAGTKHGDLVETFLVDYRAVAGGPVIKEDPKVRIRRTQ